MKPSAKSCRQHMYHNYATLEANEKYFLRLIDMTARIKQQNKKDLEIKN